MTVSILFRIFLIFLGFIFVVSPVGIQAGDINLSMKEIELGEMVESPSQMTEKQLNDLFGEDPYLGQTSYLQSPDGYSQRQKSK